MQTVERYGRWHYEFALETGVEQVVFTAPDGSREARPAFGHQPARLAYDEHGYERVEPIGKPTLAVRYTPTDLGLYRYRATRGDYIVDEGELRCEPSAHPGYVEISPNDPRYFCFSDGQPYCALGLDLCGPPRYPLPRSMAHFETGDDTASLGMGDYARWLRLIGDNGGNFIRIWLSNPYFQTETEVAGELDLAQFARLDRLIELARQHGVRLKLCFDHFRTFAPGSPFARVLRHPEDGRSPANMDEWLTEPAWRERWLVRARAYLARYGGDPTVMAWELWNEMDCVAASDWAVVREWSRAMLRELKALAPRQLVTQSLGSYDDLRKQRPQDDLRDMPEMDFQQVHRYLDQGAPWAICRTDPVAFSIQAIQGTRRPDRPILLAETGAVNDRHTGPFRYYRWDERGIIFHDTTYPAFFAGSAGSGHIWHWDSYVDQKDLWPYLRPLADLIAGVQLDAEGFKPVDLSTESFWCLALMGKEHILLYARNRADRWDKVLRDRLDPPVLRHQSVDLSAHGARGADVETFWPWPQEATGEVAALKGETLQLPAFKYAVMVRLTRATQ
jgi:hypothetical protein